MVIDGQTSGVTISGAAIPGAADGLRVGSSVRVLPPRPGSLPRPVATAGLIWGPSLSTPATEIRSLAVTGFAQGSGIVVAAAATVEDVSVAASSIGISVVGARAAVVRTSSITNSLSWGLYAAGPLAGSSLTGNTVSGSGLLGIYLDNASGLSVTANTTSGGAAKGLYSTGIYVGGQSAGTTLTENTSSGNGNGLLLVDAQGATIERNQFISNRGFGVLASGNSTGTTLRGNTISGNGRNTSLTRAFGLIGTG
jgi:parallel beta-helix repeat protein